MTTRMNNGQHGRSFPGGAGGVALTSGIIGALATLLAPRAWIDELSWQLYLDRLVAAAAPPIGMTGHLVFALAVALALALLGWLLATVLRVRPMAGGVSALVARLRGARSDDEPDAPYLRPLDRHPDAPARRPFSAARDVPVDAEPGEDERARAPVFASDPAFDDDDDDELLLDAHFDSGLAADVPPPAPVAPATWEALDHVDAADAAGDGDGDGDGLENHRPGDERATGPAVTTAQPEPVLPAGPDTGAAQAMAPAPLDLSIARLDDLIARLEAGLSRRAEAMPATRAVAVTAKDSVGTGDAPVAAGPSAELPPAEEPIVQNDGDFPHDPALAAALATLRRMNRNA